MWFLYSIFAMLLLAARRTTEKKLLTNIPSSVMAWLQQVAALPFLILMLPFAVWYNPFTLGADYWVLLVAVSIVYAIDLVLYYKAIQIADISIVAPLLNLSAVSGILMSSLFLDQPPTVFGWLAAFLIVTGAYFNTRHRDKSKSFAENNSLGIVIVLFLVILRGVYSPIEVTLLRETNPIYFNFISSVITIPLVTILLVFRQMNGAKSKYLTRKVARDISRHRIALLFIGATMAVNIFFSLTAKETAPNAGYVTAIKGAQVVPMAFIGVLLFKEHVTKRQWLGITLITLGLVSFLLS